MGIENFQLERKKAEMWRKPTFINDIEKGRYPHERALRKIVSGVIEEYVPAGTQIFEVGAGLGYLKTLVPQMYHSSYISSDYSSKNLKGGQKRRELEGLQASGYSLPLRNNSQDCVVSMDAYDTFANLGKGMREVKRVLKKDGTFINFQVNTPSDDTVQEDYPDLIFFPTRYDKRHTGIQLVGMTRENLTKGMATIETPGAREAFRSYLEDPEGKYIEIMKRDNATEIVNAFHVLLDAMPVDRTVISSLPDYFKSKMERKSNQAGLKVVESEFRGTSVIVKRSPGQMNYPDYNQFCLEQGLSFVTKNSELKMRGSKDVLETASMLVFVAKKVE